MRFAISRLLRAAMLSVGFGGSVVVGVEAPEVAAEASEAAVDAKMLLSTLLSSVVSWAGGRRPKGHRPGHSLVPEGDGLVAVLADAAHRLLLHHRQGAGRMPMLEGWRQL